MNVVELIRKKRNGSSLNEAEFHFLISGYVEGIVPDYQMSAFLMACYFNGMSEKETMTFTRLMLHSGDVVDLSDIPGVKVDKHSTGGVGDKVSIILAPMVAACGVPVPMISGRGLGHTGGTLDKLESIPGFITNLTVHDFRKVLQQTGLAMIGQTKEIAPADKKMYALRDVTATVECIPLIAGSIMSKKLAEGIDSLVLDVKTGRGAFMQTMEKSLELAEALVKIGNEFGKETIAFITEMSHPLGMTIGNWLEAVECVECLRGERGEKDHSADLMELTYVLGGAMLMLGKKTSTIDEGIQRCREAIRNGAAYRKFLELVQAQGGQVDAIENLQRYPLSKHSVEIKSAESGFVTDIDALEMGFASTLLGAGRQKIDDTIDPKAGIILKRKVGDSVESGDTLAIVLTDREDTLSEVKERITASFRVGATQPPPQRLILKVIDKKGIREWGH